MGNDEIKEILDKLIKDENVQGFIISGDLFKKLKNYITTLEQAVKDTKDSYGDMLYELQQENEELKINQRYYKNGVFSLEYDKETMSDMIDDYKSRCEKAIEYINNYFVLGAGSDYQNNLLNILQNGSEEK